MLIDMCSRKEVRKERGGGDVDTIEGFFLDPVSILHLAIFVCTHARLVRYIWAG